MDELDELATRLAGEFNFPPETLSELADALLLAAGFLQQKRRPTLRERERQAERRLKADPSDDDAWAELFTIRQGRKLVAFDARTRELTEQRTDVNRRSRSRADRGLTAALVLLCRIYERAIGEARLVTWPGAESPALLFLSKALTALGVHSTKTTPDALRKRLERASH